MNATDDWLIGPVATLVGTTDNECQTANITEKGQFHTGSGTGYEIAN